MMSSTSSLKLLEVSAVILVTLVENPYLGSVLGCGMTLSTARESISM